MIEWLPLIMFAVVCLALMLGYPVAFTLSGVALLFASAGIVSGHFDASLLLAYPDRIFGTLTNTTLIAVPLFIFMGVLLERSKIAEALLENMGHACSRFPAGLGLSVVLVGALMAASTGIVGATVVTMGLMSLPTMLNRKYSESLASGVICATGTLGQIIPPSIALVLLGDIMSTAYQQSQLNLGIYNATPISVGDLFLGAIVPGAILVLLYLLYLAGIGLLKPEQAPAFESESSPSAKEMALSIFPPLILIVLVLGSIISGSATPTEAAGVVFHGFGGETLIHSVFESLPGGKYSALLLVMLIIFLLGFILDFIEITFVVIPLIAPVLLQAGFDPIWLGILIAVNLQTSFLTPPFGFALFYLRGVAPSSLPTTAIYRGVIPFIIIQLFLLLLLLVWPDLATWLPERFR